MGVFRSARLIFNTVLPVKFLINRLQLNSPLIVTVKSKKRKTHMVSLYEVLKTLKNKENPRNSFAHHDYIFHVFIDFTFLPW